MAAERGGTEAVWIGRDLGFRGGRRSGLALTDDLHLEIHGRRWEVACKQPTKGMAVRERTASVVWRLLSRIREPVFLWNVFPLHPHGEGEPFSNRAHKAAEGRVGEAMLVELLNLVRPRRVVAIGNAAAESAERSASGAEVVRVRHPSYGGQREFQEQICGLYGLSRPRFGHVDVSSTRKGDDSRG